MKRSLAVAAEPPISVLEFVPAVMVSPVVPALASTHTFLVVEARLIVSPPLAPPVRVMFVPNLAWAVTPRVMVLLPPVRMSPSRSET